MFSRKGIRSLIFVIGLSFICLSQVDMIGGGATYKNLIHTLLDKYDTLERPVANDSDVLNVSIGLTILRLISVNEVKSTVQTNMWLSVDWNDNNLKWNESDHGNISSVRIPPNRMWLPDVYFYNQVGDVFDTTHQTMAVVKSDGNVSYIPPGVFETSCMISVEDYPFEELKCEFKIGSWTHDGFQMDLVLSSESGGDTSSLLKNPEWKVTGFPAKRNSVYYSCCDEPYIDLTFTLELKRNGSDIWSSACWMNFVICSSILLSCIVPPSSGYKIAIGMFEILICAWAEMFFTPVPRGIGTSPRLVTYFGRLLVVAFTTLVVNVVTFSLYHKKGLMPEMIRGLLINKVYHLLKPLCPLQKSVNSPGIEMSDDRRIPPMNDLQELICRIDDMAKEQESKDFMNDWQYFAVVIDRLLFVFWSIFVVIFAAAAFPSFTA